MTLVPYIFLGSFKIDKIFKNVVYKSFLLLSYD